jgi:hypothetical protein
MAGLTTLGLSSHHSFSYSLRFRIMLQFSDHHRYPFSRNQAIAISRKVEVFAPMNLTDADKWSLVETLVKVERRRPIFDPQTREWQPGDGASFYISTTVLSAETFCMGIRGHWQIENGDHHVRDVTLAED